MHALVSFSSPGTHVRGTAVRNALCQSLARYHSYIPLSLILDNSSNLAAATLAEMGQNPADTIMLQVATASESGYYVMIISTHARPVLVHPHHALTCSESRSWSTGSNKST